MADKKDLIQPISDGTFDDVVGAIVGDADVPVVSGPVPKAIADGYLEIGDKSLPCAVLDDVHNTRVLTQEGFLKSIGRAGKAKGGEGSTVDGLPPFLRAKNLIPFIDSNLLRSTEPIVYETLRGQKAFGYRATLLPSVCWVYQDALMADKLLPSQDHVARACSQLLRGLTDRAINDMVDEATGFRSLQRRRALEEVLREYVTPEALPWALTFDDELYMNIFRLNGWEYNESSIKKRPGVVGRWTNDFYERLAPGVLAEIQRTVPRDEKGRPKVRYHQMLTEHVGHPKLKEFLEGIKALMRISPDWDTFQHHLSRAYPHYDETLQLTFLDKLRITK
ncbi:P63C domain-containing protein [Antarctobacter heliothermus]|uniref:P63C domain-containing protein n=1 Tax=Antarctobacter heliothermus TaxID=74033 RepID=A0A239BKP6_9RHOB|nr:P63C domain-containing protein [Antarctobacter heliothermus]SNS08159.1 P63C domain-containing protein [Antarctobacter heliothermus]